MYDGVQIINITDPAKPTPAATIRDGRDGFEGMYVADGVAITQISGHTYAVVTTNSGVQIINITDPAKPTPAATIRESRDGWFGVLSGGDFATTPGFVETHMAKGVAITQISGHTYAVVVSYGGVLIIDITDPAKPTQTAVVLAYTDGFGDLFGSESVAITQISGHTYAVVALRSDGGVQIIDITDPAKPTPAAAVFDDADWFGAGEAFGVAITQISGHTYAVAVSPFADDGVVRIIDITDPAKPAQTAAIYPGDGGFGALFGGEGVAITQISGHTYAAVTSDVGMQIIDITDPAKPTPAAEIRDGRDGFEALHMARDVAITQISGHTYAVVASWSDDGVQIVDITDPAKPAPIAAVFDDADTALFDSDEGITGTAPVTVFDDADGFGALDGADEVAITDISGHTYAVVASRSDGVQIINITDPAKPTPAAEIRAGRDGFGAQHVSSADVPRVAYAVAIAQISGHTYAAVPTNGGMHIINITDPAKPTPAAAIYPWEGVFETLAGGEGVAIAQISGHTYAVVASWYSRGVQIINITDPAKPTPAAAVFDDVDGFEALSGPNGVAITDISGHTYAVVTSWYDGVQIIDITNPAKPTPTAAIYPWDGVFGTGGEGVATTQISGNTYAVVTSNYDVQIIDITNPAKPTPAAEIRDGMDGFEALHGANGVTITQISGHTYAVVVSYEGVQIIDITDPAKPTPAAAVFDDADGFEALYGSHGVAITQISGHTYAVVTSWYDGVQILRLAGE